MNKGLKALKRYRDIPTTIDYDIIEKELKALEVIKERKIIPLEQLDYLYLGGKIDKETRDLLKEVLLDGK